MATSPYYFASKSLHVVMRMRMHVGASSFLRTPGTPSRADTTHERTHSCVRDANVIASMKRAASTTRYICILLPEDTPPELHAALPVSTDAAHVARLTAADDMPEGNVDGCVWMPGTPASRLTSMLDAHPEISWVHSFSAGVDGIADVIRERLCNSEVGLSNGRGAFSSSLAEYAVAAMLHFNKQLTRCEGNRRKRKWDKFVMPVVAGKTMGLVGFEYGYMADNSWRTAQHPPITILCRLRIWLALQASSDFMECPWDISKEVRQCMLVSKEVR